eukprot:SAG11_NODE_19975_length_455_cov_0.721910_1_plen_34_part_10
MYYKSKKDTDEPLGLIALHAVTSIVRKEETNEIK